MPESGTETSTVPVGWANLEFFLRDPNDFLSRLVTMDETCLYNHDRETKQQSMEWRHSGTRPPPKIPSAYIRRQISRLEFFEIKWHPLHWLSYKEPDYQCGVFLISAGAIEGYFEGKTPRDGHQGGLVLARQCSVSPGANNPEVTGLPGLPICCSPTLFSGSGPVGLPSISWFEKTIESWPFFVRRGGQCWRGVLVGRTIYWIFFEWLAEPRTTG